MMKLYITDEQSRELNDKALNEISQLILNGVSRKSIHYLIDTTSMLQIIESYPYRKDPELYYYCDFHFSQVTGYRIEVYGMVEKDVGHVKVFSLETKKMERCDALWEVVKCLYGDFKDNRGWC